MRIQYGKLYQYHEAFQPVDFIVSTKNGWKHFAGSTMFVVLQKKKSSFLILLPNGETGELFTRSTRLKLAEL